MYRESCYFLISLFVHVFLIVLCFFICCKLSIRKNYFTVVNKGGVFSVSLVSSLFETNSSKTSSSNEKKLKQISNSPISKNAEVTTKRSSRIENIYQKNLSTGSSVKYGKSTQVIPLTKSKNIINFISPVYPKSCLALGQQGTVILRVLVTNEGKIVDNKIYKSSGYKLLDQSVIDASKLWTINTPPLQMTWVEIVINFVIN